MKLIFLDETENIKSPDFYGICAVSIDGTQYTNIAFDFLDRIKQSRWSEDTEFKGRFLFSSSKGDTEVSVDQRIELVRQILELNVAKKNARLKAAFAWNHEGNSKNNHLILVE